jgi:O-antigen ligase
MLHPGTGLHRSLLAVLLLGNAVAFAGVDPPTQAVTALLALLLAIDLAEPPPVSRPVRALTLALAGLLLLQLVPLPQALRSLIQPGFSELMARGWAPLSLAPWATVRLCASLVVAAIVATTAARMAWTRSGLPVLLWILTGTAATLALLGVATEAGLPERVLLIRDNTGGGMPYGSFVNRNHFALALELALPAAAAMLAGSIRRLPGTGSERRRAVAETLVTASIVMLGLAALLRCGSRGGVLVASLGAVLSVPLWRRQPLRLRRLGAGLPGLRLLEPRALARLWATAAGLGLVLVLAAGMATTRLPELADRMTRLLQVESGSGSTRMEIWQGTLASWRRSPLLGSGAGSYGQVIGPDRPPTGTRRLEHSHGSWLEWLSTTGLAGALILVAAVALVAPLLRPSRLRRLRSELRYPQAAAGAALASLLLHELIISGLRTPINRYLAAVWLGLLWGLAVRTARLRRRRPGAGDGQVGDATGDETGDATNATDAEAPVPAVAGPAAVLEAGSQGSRRGADTP